MVDFIYHTRDLFLKVKEGFEVPAEVKQKYDTLFNETECFQSTGFVTKPYIKRVDKRAPLPRKTFARAARKIFSAGDLPHIKKVKTILNVMNVSNYDKQLNKLKFIIEDRNVEEIAWVIIDTGVLQFFYVKLYVNLLNDIASNQGYKTVILKVIETFVDDFVGKRLMAQSPQDINLSEYDMFCVLQKDKTTKVSSGMLILYLIKQGLITRDIYWYLEKLIDYCNAGEEDEHIMDIVLNILLESKKINGHVVSYPVQWVARCSKVNKLRFLFDDLSKV